MLTQLSVISNDYHPDFLLGLVISVGYWLPKYVTTSS